jgi:hypothetical protein
LLVLILFLVAAAFGLGAILGAPYLPILKRDSRPLIELADLKPGQTLIDLGSGDGRLLRAAAAQGIRCIGYEINPLLVFASRLMCWRYRRLVSIHLADFWHVHLPPADAIYVFLIDRYMARLDRKLTAELTRSTRVISFVFQIPGRPAARHNSNTYVYEYPAAHQHRPDLKKTV